MKNNPAEVVRELKRLLRFCGERPGAAVYSERMEGASAARHEIRMEIRNRIRFYSQHEQNVQTLEDQEEACKEDEIVGTNSEKRQENA